MIKIAIVDDDPILLSRMANLVEMQEAWKCIFQAHSLGELFEKTDTANPPDILLLDIQLKEINSLEHLGKIRKVLPRTKIIIMTGYTRDKFVLDAIKNGANGYIIKGGKPAEFIAAIRETLSEGAYLGGKAAIVIVEHLRQMGHVSLMKDTAEQGESLSEREQEVAYLLVEGVSYKAIADQLFISINTVRQHVKTIYRKLDVQSKIQLRKKLSISNQ